MPGIGVTTILTGGRGVRASADGLPRVKTGGITVDWTTVTAVAVATTLDDGRIAAIGQSYIRYGTVMCKITTGGKFGPYSALASDGRELLERGNCFILNETVILEQDLGSHNPAVFDGGRVFEARVTDLATNPSLDDLNEAFPDVTWVRD
jgi:hypothetical protein